MNRMTWPCRVRDFLEHRLQPLLELAAVLRAGDQRAHVERDDPLVLQPLGHVAAHDALRQPLDDGRLADAGLADEHRVVLGAARQHLDDAADLLVAADDRIELALARELGQVAAVPLERLVRALGILVGDALRAADRGQRLRGCASCVTPRCCSSRAAGERPASAAIASEQVLGADVLVLEPLGFLLGGVVTGRSRADSAGSSRRARCGSLSSSARATAATSRRIGVHLPRRSPGRCRRAARGASSSRCSGVISGWPRGRRAAARRGCFLCFLGVFVRCS